MVGLPLPVSRACIGASDVNMPADAHKQRRLHAAWLDATAAANDMRYGQTCADMAKVTRVPHCMRMPLSLSLYIDPYLSSCMHALSTDGPTFATAGCEACV